MNKKHSIFLSDEQRLQLVDLVKKGKANAREIRVIRACTPMPKPENFKY